MSAEKRENPDPERVEEAKRKADFVEVVVKSVIHKSVFGLPVCMGHVPINWAMWENRYKEDMPGVIPECKLLAAFLTVIRDGGYLGSFEVQMWVHSVILYDLLSLMSGHLKCVLAGVMKMRELEKNDSYAAMVLDKVIWCLQNRCTPVVGEYLLWGSGRRFGIDDHGLN